MKLLTAIKAISDRNGYENMRVRRDRIVNNAAVPDGEAPDYNAAELMDQLMAEVAEKGELKRRIHETNTVTLVTWKDQQITLGQAVLERDRLISLAEEANNVLNSIRHEKRHARSNVKITVYLSTREWQDKADNWAQTARELTELINMTNAQTDLVA